MRGDLPLYPPATYSPGWALVGLALLVAALVFVVAIVLATRPGGVPRPNLGRRSTRVRRACLRRIDKIDAAHRAGAMDAPMAASELSQAVRVFAARWSGTLYPAMTLAEMEARGGDERLRAAVAQLYDGAFTSGGADLDVAAAAQMAREVVRTWNRT